MPVKWLLRDELVNTAKSKIHTVDTVLDIGCGIAPQPFITPCVHICYEPFSQYVEHLKDRTHDSKNPFFVYINAGIDQLPLLIPPQSVETVFLLDVIEHIEKDEGLKLISTLKKIAKKQIVIFTPLGFVPQFHPDGKDAWGLDGANFQEHKSGWTPEDFDDTWDIVACKEYHLTNNLGVPYEKPHGAFYAIYNSEKALKEGKTRQLNLNYFANEILTLKEAAQNTTTKLDAALSERNALRSEIENIYNSRLWRILIRIKRLLKPFIK